MDEKDLLVINIDVTTAVTTAAGAMPEIMALRERASKLVEFETKEFDNLETYALALMHVQGEYVAASTPPEELLALNGRARRCVTCCVGRHGARQARADDVPSWLASGGAGYKVLAEDLVGLSALLRDSWDRVSAKTAITMTELDQAEELSDKLLSAVGAREQAPAALAEVSVQRRARFFTLFVQSYDQVRRAIDFLRWNEDDLETIAPLVCRRGNAGRSRRTASGHATGGATAPALSGTAAPLPGPAVGPPANPSPVAIGLPGSSVRS